MNQRQAEKAYSKAFMDGVEATIENVMRSSYAAAALAAHRKFGFGKDRCAVLLNELDKIVCDYFTSAEIIDAALNEIGLVINFRDDGIEPVKTK